MRSRWAHSGGCTVLPDFGACHAVFGWHFLEVLCGPSPEAAACGFAPCVRCEALPISPEHPKLPLMLSNQEAEGWFLGLDRRQR